MPFGNASQNTPNHPKILPEGAINAHGGRGDWVHGGIILAAGIFSCCQGNLLKIRTKTCRIFFPIFGTKAYITQKEKECNHSH